MRVFLIFTMVTVLFYPAAYTFAGDYIVGEGDVLSITVYEHDDMSTVARVTYAGTISVPLIGQVVVKDMTVSQIAKKLTGLFSDGYIVDPQVNIFIKEYRSRKAIILGQVNTPGIYNLREQTSLLELISQAGGMTKLACSKAIIKRKTQAEDDSSESVIKINLKQLVEEGENNLNIQIKDGDSIYIPKNDVYYVTGEIKKPDAYEYEESSSVIKAITMAGGFTAKASKTAIQIIRKIQGKEEVLADVKMDEPILPEDVIVVPESFF
ncbi:MAG: periplasmic polysaccharide biosynthesis/export protein [Desulfobacteraceae bacterium]|nr:MAG: periplasmic polysaccharide biosynthesis/export protein [Desulfobacteraceae bacterium]